MRLCLREQEVQEVLAVLGEEVEAAEMLVLLQVLLEQEIMAVMVQQGAMAEEGGVEGLLVIMAEVLVAVALAALD